MADPVNAYVIIYKSIPFVNNVTPKPGHLKVLLANRKNNSPSRVYPNAHRNRLSNDNSQEIQISLCISGRKHSLQRLPPPLSCRDLRRCPEGKDLTALIERKVWDVNRIKLQTTAIQNLLFLLFRLGS